MNFFKFESLNDFPSPIIIEPRIFKDERGYFFESFLQKEFSSTNFVQDNESKSSYGVINSKIKF